MVDVNTDLFAALATPNSVVAKTTESKTIKLRPEEATLLHCRVVIFSF